MAVKPFDPLLFIENVLATSRLVALIDIDECRLYLEHLDRYDSIMPILDPTSYQERMDAVPNHRKLVKALLEYRKVIEELRP